MQVLRLPQDQVRFRCTATVGGVTLTLRLWWLPRPAAWYVTVELADGTVVASTQRVTPGSPLLPDRTFPGLPTDGVLVALGLQDPYPQTALGTSLQIAYLSLAEAAEAGLL